jgi:phosphoribosylformimino-5-aminoimidazole carboxamide ribotide isomerase
VQVIGVIDVRGGQAVHARAGARHSYRPVKVPGSHATTHGDALSLARFYLQECGVRELYLADLDAIDGKEPQHALTRRLTALGAPVWVDAGVSQPRDAVRTVEDGAARVVVGLETLPSMIDLRSIREAIGGSATAFSLDLRNGRPLTRGTANQQPAETLANEAVAAGVGAIIVLDLSRVGTGRGIDLELLSRVRTAAPDVMLLAGGGIAGREDLDNAVAIGCDALLVASALIEGRLTAADVSHASSTR